jgi:hypothetical protein
MNSERCQNWLLSAELSNFDAALSNFAALMRERNNSRQIHATLSPIFTCVGTYVRTYVQRGVSFALFLPAFLRTYNAGLSFALLLLLLDRSATLPC